MAFVLERTFPITKSCSAQPQNLSLIHIPDHRVYHLAVIHKHSVCVASFSPDDSNLANCRVVETGEKPGDSETIYQGKWLQFGHKTLFVLCSDRGFQVYEADGVSMMYSQSFSNEKKRNDLECVGARCACALGASKMLIGRSDGTILSYGLPNFSNGRGESFVAGHSALVDIATSADGQNAVSCDDSGLVVLWTVDSMLSLQVLSKSRVGSGWPCVSVGFWRRWIAVATTTGAVYIIDSKDMTVNVEIFAHFRSLNAMDILTHSSSLGLLITAGEDTEFRVFALRENNSDSIDVEQCAAGAYPNQYICGARFLVSPSSSSARLPDLRVALSSYESPNVAIFRCKLTG